MAVALGVAALDRQRGDQRFADRGQRSMQRPPAHGGHAQALVKLELVKLGATRQAIDPTLGVTTGMGGGPSLMVAAVASAAFDEVSRAAPASGAPIAEAAAVAGGLRESRHPARCRPAR